jgi:7,8-dihydropterin-6-yl-methyl-4-(beta-D-ribofuranosyl)aminobenzene 5'-phosphate synthase
MKITVLTDNCVGGHLLAEHGLSYIIEYKNIKAVIGGFHLKFLNTQTYKTIDYFKRNEVELIYPSHCTELPALVAFYNAFKIS